jgi:hypothetical protein
VLEPGSGQGFAASDGPVIPAKGNPTRIPFYSERQVFEVYFEKT